MRTLFLCGALILWGATPGSTSLQAQDFVRGDVNQDDSTDLFDAIFLAAYFYSAGNPLPNPNAADANDNGAPDVTDLVYLLNFVMNFGPPPPPPFPGPGPDPTPNAFPPAEDSSASYEIGTAMGMPGQEGLLLPIRLSSAHPVAALELALTYETDSMLIDGWDLNGSILPGAAEYVVTAQLNLPGLAHGWLAAVVDFATPYGNEVIPAGTDLLVAHVVISIPDDAEAPQLSPVVLEDGVGQPPKNNLIALADGQALAPILIHGVVDVRVPFIRGDANRDELIDISDAISIMAFLFTSGAQPACAAAADINNDTIINVADPIYLLNYFFGIGPSPSLPFPTPGFDAGDTMGCNG